MSKGDPGFSIEPDALVVGPSVLERSNHPDDDVPIRPAADKSGYSAHQAMLGDGWDRVIHFYRKNKRKLVSEKRKDWLSWVLGRSPDHP